MKLGLIGIGGAGSRITDMIRGVETDSNRQLCHDNLLTIDISRTVSNTLDHVADENRITIGDTHHKVKKGVSGDQDLAAKVTRADFPEIQRALDSISMHKMDGILVTAGLGGGTGSGASSVVVNRLQEIYDKPVYVLGILPATSEGGCVALNAARSLKSIVPVADSTLLFDNDRWVKSETASDDTEPIEDRYKEANHELASRIITLFAREDRTPSSIGANTVDSSDIIRTLSPGGVASIGYATTELDDEGLLSWLLSVLPGIHGNDESPERTAAGKIQDLVRQSLNSQLSLPCEVSSTERVLVVVSGPPDELSRRGFESARQLLEKETETVEIRAGDAPQVGASTVRAVVLLSNVTKVQRIDAIQRLAIEQQYSNDEL